MSEHPCEVLLLEVLLVSSNPEFKEGLTESLFEHPCEKLEGGLDSMLTSFSVSLFEGFGEMEELREAIS
jgi:hypothetical protein